MVLKGCFLPLLGEKAELEDVMDPDWIPWLGLEENSEDSGYDSAMEKLIDSEFNVVDGVQTSDNNELEFDENKIEDETAAIRDITIAIEDTRAT